MKPVRYILMMMMSLPTLGLTGCGTGAGEAVATASAALSATEAVTQALSAMSTELAASLAAGPKPVVDGQTVIYFAEDKTVIYHKGQIVVVPKPEWQR